MAINQLNLPAIYQAAEQTKAMRTQNALADYTLGNAKQFNALAPQIAAGDNTAYSEGLAVNPEGAMNLRTGGAADQKRQLDEFGKVAGHILSLPPEQRPQAWATTGRNEVLRIFGVDESKVPPEYDEGQLKMVLSRVAEASGGKWGQPKAGIGPDGKPAYFQVSDAGETRPVPGYAPQPKAPLVQNVIGGDQKEEDKKYGAYRVEEYGGVVKAATDSQQALGSLSIAARMDATSELPSELKQIAGNFAVSAGIPLPESMLNTITNGQTFNGVMGDLVLSKLQSQKGPQTENDAKRIEKTVAGLGNTPEARKFLLRAAQSVAIRDIDRREFWDSYRAENGTFDGAGREWNRVMGKTPMVGQHPKDPDLTIFFNEFRDLTMQANPDATLEQIVDLWKSKYVGTR